MTEQVTFTAFIRGGLPVEVTATIERGYGSSYMDPGCPDEVEIDEVRWLSRRSKDGRRRTGGLVPSHIVEAITEREMSYIAESAFEAL